MKISIITISLNNKKEIKDTIESVLSQNYSNIEYILIDGGSTDGSFQLIKSYSDKIDYIVSEPDNGIYSAINKGLKLATGEIIGLLHAGDLFFEDTVLNNIEEAFQDQSIDLIYGHSLVLNKKRNKIIRKNISPVYKNNLMRLGWFPSHQSIYMRSKVFEKCGYYNEDYKIAGDYEFILRVLYVFKLKAKRLDKIIIKFYLGGKSSKSITNILKSNYECINAWQNNNLRISFYTIPLKIIRKISQSLLSLLRLN